MTGKPATHSATCLGDNLQGQGLAERVVFLEDNAALAGRIAASLAHA